MIEIETATPCGQVLKVRMARKLPNLSPYFTAAYFVDGLMIDTGCAHTCPELVPLFSARRVELVVNTHSHEDHIGANAALQERFRCSILAHPQALPILHNPRLQPLQPYRRLFWGWPLPSKGQALGEWVHTEHFRFEVISTPGHSPDHVCLFESERGWLFSGDAYIGGKDRALRAGYDIHQIITSLKRLAELPVSTIFSGSGTVRDNGAQALQDKVAYLEELGERIRSLREHGLSRRRIRRQLFGPEPQIAYLTLGHFSGTRLIESYLDTPAAGAPAPSKDQGAGEALANIESVAPDRPGRSG